jgi:ABC-type dipeptide/oligopeptide/nickel transport system permease component
VKRTRYIARRLVAALVTIFVAVTLNFMLFRLVPGDFSTNRSQIPNAPPALRASIKHEFGLDRPKWEQYFLYIKQLARGNLGVSFENRRPVTSNLWRATRNTVPMVAVGLFFATFFGIMAGVIAAWRRRTAVDQGLLTAGLACYAMPAQWLGLMLLIAFAGILPAFGMSDPFLLHPSFFEHLKDVGKHMILPAVTVALGSFGQYCVLTRSAVLETLGEDYILVAKAKGLATSMILRRYALRNALLPITTLLALSIGSIVGGVILTETVFSWPGIGLATYNAVTERDYPMLEGSFLLLTVSVVCWNALADIVAVRLDPRIVDER